MSEWAGQSVYVMGLGRFGGGVGVSRFLASQGAIVLIGDRGDPDGLADSIGQIQDLIDAGDVRLALREHSLDDLNGIDTLVVNPAVPKPWENSFICEARSRGLSITTEIEIAWKRIKCTNVIAVTGSAGKSTTSGMIHHALRELDIETVLGGNIGGSLLTVIDRVSDDSIVVFELSSAMLYWLGESGAFENAPPRVGCVTNCNPNHLDWHGTPEHYEQSKRVLAKYAKHLVVGPELVDWRLDACAVGNDDAVQGCFVPGQHNGLNAAMAVRAVCVHQGVDESRVTDVVRGYKGLPHRLELVHEADGVRFFNDSKCTVPGATILAVEAIEKLVDRSRIHLIVGGYDKGSDLSPISMLSEHIAGLYGIGNTGEGVVSGSTGFAMNCGNLDVAMKAISERVQHGEVVLLSPGCASWDQFTNYEERGNRFAELARIIWSQRV